MSNRLLYVVAVFAVALSAPFSHAVLTGDITGPSQSAGFPSGLSDGVGEARVRFSRALVGNQAGVDLVLAQTAGTAGQTAADFSTPLPMSTENLLVELLYDGGSNFTLRTTGSQLAPGPVSEITRDFSTVENVGDFALRSLQFRTKADTAGNFEMIVANAELRNTMGDVLPLPAYDSNAAASERFSFVNIGNIAGAEDGFTFSAVVQPLNVGGVTSTGDENLNFEVLFGGEVVPAMNGGGGGGAPFALIDVGPSGQDVEEGAIGFPDTGAPGNNANGTNFSGTILIDGTPVMVSLTNVDQTGASVGGIDWRDRGDSANDDQDLVDLGEDFVKNNAGVIRMTLEGLPAGEYLATSFHEDPNFDQSDMIEVLVDSDGMGFVNTGALGMDQNIGGLDNLTTDIMLSGAANFSFTAMDGVPVILIFDGRLSGDNETPFNGLRLQQVQGVPEPATALLGLLGLGALAARRRRDAA